jgi:hypothetical protein
MSSDVDADRPFEIAREAARIRSTLVTTSDDVQCAMELSEVAMKNARDIDDRHKRRKKILEAAAWAALALAAHDLEVAS